MRAARPRRLTPVAAGLAALLLTVVSGSLAALSSPSLVKDIDPYFLTNVNGTLFFQADSGEDVLRKRDADPGSTSAASPHG